MKDDVLKNMENGINKDLAFYMEEAHRMRSEAVRSAFASLFKATVDLAKSVAAFRPHYLIQRQAH